VMSASILAGSALAVSDVEWSFPGLIGEAVF